jgi:pimeloyl-ACP methyl ester carboxylesterase
MMTYSEAPVFFDAVGETLFGIVTEPLGRQSRVAAVQFRGGNQGPSSGRNQTSTRLSRRLASAGYISFRFDYRGVGESSGSIERISLDQPFVEDATGAIRYLRGLGIERFVLIGSCFGAQMALSCAENVAELDGVVLLSPPVRTKQKDEHGTTKVIPETSVRHLMPKAFSPRVWMALSDPDRRRSYLRRAQTIWPARKKTIPGRIGSVIDPPWMNPLFIQTFEQVVGRRVPLLFLRGTKDPGFHDFDEAMSGRMGEIAREAGSLIDVEILEGRVGAFADGSLQDAVIELIHRWVTNLQGRMLIDQNHTLHPRAQADG